jgi:hypothetical protein
MMKKMKSSMMQQLLLRCRGSQAYPAAVPPATTTATPLLAHSV